jgi:DNA invertase Pin-like site-specific DNA recombinase
LAEETKKTRAAAYCRVSTLADFQDGSYEVQCEYYRKLIEADPAMELVGIYGDHGKSGKNMKNRPEFQRMIKDCEAGKIDLILTKSISRFARNLKECIAMIRHLRELGVAVKFEREGISTADMDSELLLSILATIAEEESRSIGLNMRWSRQKHNEKGMPWEAARYGYISIGKEHRWEVVPQEAEHVRQAFYLAGMCFTYPEIIEEMNNLEEAEGTGKVWNHSTILNMLESLAYTGDYLTNKECTIVDEDGQVRRVKNKGYVDQYLLENHHEAVISHELYDAVQDLLKHKILFGNRSRFSAEDQAVMAHSMEVAEKERESWTRQSLKEKNRT